MKWIIADKRELSLEEMETTHIRNSIAKIRRSIRLTENGTVKGWRASWLRPLLDELKRRGIKDQRDLNPARITNRFRNLDID